MEDKQVRQRREQFPRPRHRGVNVSSGQAQYDHEVIEVSRVVRVVKGGRRFRFRTCVVAGDHQGKVGFGIGKSKDVQESIQQAYNHAAKNVVEVPLVEGTIPHESRAKFKGADVLLRPARKGTGVIAGSAVRTVADLAGIKDIVSKAYGSSNKISNVCATLKALQRMKWRKESRNTQ